MLFKLTPPHGTAAPARFKLTLILLLLLLFKVLELLLLMFGGPPFTVPLVTALVFWFTALALYLDATGLFTIF